jgi:hypothetical protein
MNDAWTISFWFTEAIPIRVRVRDCIGALRMRRWRRRGRGIHPATTVTTAGATITAATAATKRLFDFSTGACLDRRECRRIGFRWP